jgi:hypothetical protein
MWRCVSASVVRSRHKQYGPIASGIARGLLPGRRVQVEFTCFAPSLLPVRRVHLDVYTFHFLPYMGIVWWLVIWDSETRVDVTPSTVFGSVIFGGELSFVLWEPKKEVVLIFVIWESKEEVVLVYLGASNWVVLRRKLSKSGSRVSTSLGVREGNSVGWISRYWGKGRCRVSSGSFADAWGYIR